MPSFIKSNFKRSSIENHNVLYPNEHEGSRKLDLESESVVLNKIVKRYSPSKKGHSAKRKHSDSFLYRENLMS
jgi:hypothetical protein